MRLLERVLVEVIDRRLPFDMSVFAASEKEPNDCGTAACAAGWLVRHPEAIADGLHFSRECALPILSVPDARPALWPCGYSALAAYLEMEVGVAHRLFSPNAYIEEVRRANVCRVTPEMVLERVRGYVACETPQLDMRAALVRVARFHARLASEETDATLMGHFLECALVCADRASAHPAMVRYDLVVLDDQQSSPLLEVRLVGLPDGTHGVVLRDLQAESAPWVEVFEDLTVSEEGDWCIDE